MNTSQFFGKLRSTYFWGNIAAMAVVVLVVCLGVRFAIDEYTHHGEAIAIPDIRHKSLDAARYMLANVGLELAVSDTGYVKALPPDCVLEQQPAAGQKVKAGRVITVIVNASHTPTISLPDIIDNSSLRDAMAKLSAMGFKLGQPEFVDGEKDWVYGVVSGGRQLATGDKVPVDQTVVIQAGNGRLSSSDSIDFIDNGMSGFETDDDIDEFQEVTEPPHHDTPSDDAPRHDHAAE